MLNLKNCFCTRRVAFLCILYLTDTGCYTETTEGGKVIRNRRFCGVETLHIVWNILKCRFIELIKSREDHLLQQILRFWCMGLMDILCSSIFLFTLVESTSRSGTMWPLNAGVESTGTISWTVFSSSIFVLVALVLSTYLIFEHLAAYNQPEVFSLCSFTFGSDHYYLCNALLPFSYCFL
ncbi:LAZ1-like 1 [Spatholobus suberectus]|nr:LAZ1-like 1 [Spatholobus suberectus]